MGISNVPTTSSQDGHTRFEQGGAQGFIQDDGTDDRVLIGKRQDGSYGFNMSKPGKDVKTAVASDLIMSSDFNLFKIVKVMTLTVNKAANSASSPLVSAAHGLSFIPSFIVYGTYDGLTYEPMPIATPEISTTGAGLVVLAAQAYVDATNINAQLLTPNTGSVHSYYGGALTLNVKFYLLQETAN